MGSPNTTPWSCAVALFVLAALDAHAQTAPAVPRWGQASAIIYDTLFVHGGKTDPSHQYTYTSAPNSNDLLTLNLTTSFSLLNPPWSYVSGSQNGSTSQGPAVAFHTLTPYTSSQMLLFGGDAGFATIGTNPDSAWLLNTESRLNPVWMNQSSGWALEPIRRVYHTAPSASGAVYILGGQKGDNSQLGFLESYLFNAVANDGLPAFVRSPLSDSSDGPAGLFGHAAHVLPGGRLIIFGGFFSSSNSPSFLNVIYMLDTTSPSPSWFTQNASGTAPSPRRGFASVLLDNGKLLIHGGADATLQNLYSDGAVLDTTQNPMSWSTVNGLSDGLGARVGHFAAPLQGRALFGFGWAGNAPAPAGLALYDLASSSFASSYTPSTAPLSVTTLPVSPTAPGGVIPTSGGNSETGGVIGGSNPTATPGSNPTGGNDGGRGGNSSNGNGSGSGSDDGNSAKSHVAGIVVGSLLGFLAFVALAGGGAYYALRRRERHAWVGIDANAPKDVEGRWQLIPGAEPWDSDESPTQPVGLQMAGTGWQERQRRRWDILGLGALVGSSASKKDNGVRRRTDILADEDAKQFNVDEAFHEDDDHEWDAVRRVATGGSSLSASVVGTGKSPWSGLMNASVTSLWNVGAALGVGTKGTAAVEQGRGGYVNPPYWWEKDNLPLDPFSDSAAVNDSEKMGSTSIDVPMRPRGGGYPSSPNASNPYVDLFSELENGHPTRDEAADRLLSNAIDEGETTTFGGAASSQASLPPSIETQSLARVTTASFTNPSGSVESHDAPSSLSTNSLSISTGPATSSSSHAHSNGYSSSISSPISPRTTSIIGAVSAPSAPMRRSDSWWSRFSRTPFRDRSLHDPSHLARNGGDAFTDIRDPNPPPRLGPIQESGQSNQTSPQTAHDTSPDIAPESKPRRHKSGSGYAASTKSSIKTDHTADSDLIERLGGRMEVVQRALSHHSRRTGSPSTTADSPALPDGTGKWGLSTVEASSSEGSHHKAWTDSSVDVEMESPISEFDRQSEGTFGTPATRAAGASSGSSSESAGPPLAGPRPPRRALTSAIAARVSAYERRMSQDFISHSGPRSPPADTKARQKEKEERKGRGSVGYGLVPKAPLFVANPDRRNPSGST